MPSRCLEWLHTGADRGHRRPSPLVLPGSPSDPVTCQDDRRHATRTAGPQAPGSLWHCCGGPSDDLPTPPPPTEPPTHTPPPPPQAGRAPPLLELLSPPGP